ncbi:MAG: ROK family protein [Anaerolineae bacterium]|nr:ROK family protein [Anaerolineae bacterium]
MSKAAAQRELALALDMGGTRIKAALIKRDGTLLDLERQPTPAQAHPDDVVTHILALSHDLAARNGLRLEQVDGIGVSMAGFVTMDGVVTATAHLARTWIGYDLGTRLRAAVAVPDYYALDSPAPTLGEAYYGAGHGIDHFVYVTVSTGIGAGIMIHGKHYTGGLGWAGGVGHIIVDENSPHVCEGCGNHGCLETFAATQGIITTTQDMLRDYPDSLILALVTGEPARITPEIVYRAAQQGDEAAARVWQRVGHMLGIGLVNLVNIVSPTRIAVGGGIAQAGELLLEPARQVIRERAFPPQHRRAEIVQAALGDLSGAYGAAAMVFHDIRVNLPE